MSWPGLLAAKDLRIATLHAELTRKGPGLLLRDLTSGKDPQVEALTKLIAAIDPDILLLTKVDIDAGGVTLATLQRWLGYPHGYAEMPNSAYFAEDLRMAWGPFAGAGGMALLSKEPIQIGVLVSYNGTLWQSVDGAVLPVNSDGDPFFSGAVLDQLRLVTQGLWVVPVADLTLVAFQNTAPVFDGPEDRNGLRSRDQLRLVGQVLDGLDSPFVAIGNTNLDPGAGQGDRAAMRSFLGRDDVRDLKPISDMGQLNTAIWDKPGPMRVSYVLPSRDIQVLDAGVVWPQNGPLREIAEQASRHRMVWMDIRQ